VVEASKYAKNCLLRAWGVINYLLEACIGWVGNELDLVNEKYEEAKAWDGEDCERYGLTLLKHVLHKLRHTLMETCVNQLYEESKIIRLNPIPYSTKSLRKLNVLKEPLSMPTLQQLLRETYARKRHVELGNWKFNQRHTMVSLSKPFLC